MTQEIMEWNLSKNNIIVRFPPLAGGKFLIGLLSFYKSFMYPVPIIFNRELMQADNLKDIKDLSYFYILNSIPPKDVREYWERYEVYMFGFWRFTVSTLIGDNARPKEDTFVLIHNKVREVLQEYKCFHVVHESTHEELSYIMPNATIVNLTDYDLIQQLSSRFKKTHSNSNRHIGKLQSSNNVINFSMKNIFNKDKFLSEIDDLAYLISGDKSVHPGIYDYYDKYKAVHL